MASLRDLPQNFSTTLNVAGGINASQTTGIVLTSVSGLPTTGGFLCLDWSANLDISVAEYIEYTGISGNELTGVTRGVEGSSAKSHSNGCTVVGIVSKSHINRINDKLRGTDTGVTLTSPKIATAILDTNGNEIIETPATTSAVNQVKITNSATGVNPTIAASGDDTYIPLLLTGKSASPRVGGVYDNGNLTGAITIDMNKGTRQKGTLTGNVTITISNPSEGEALELFLLQDATGGRTISFSTTIIWQDNTTPTWTTTASKMNVINLRFVGSTWYGVGAKFA